MSAKYINRRVESMLNRIFFYLALLALTASLLTGCAPGYSPIEGQDSRVLFPSVLVSYPIFDRNGLHGQSDYAVEAGVSHARGDAVQTLGSGEMISFAGTILQGPADVRQNFTLDEADVLLRARFPRQSFFFMQAMLGYRYKVLDLSLESGGLSAEQKIRNGGLAGGLGLGSRISDRLMIELYFLIDFNIDKGQMASGDLTASYWLTPNAAITAGFRRWEYSRSSDGESGINSLVWKGFSGGLAFSF